MSQASLTQWVTDGGREFHSTYREQFAGRYSVTLKTRPAGKLRFGSVMERIFGTSETEFIHTLSGNTQNSRNPRQMTESVNPKGRAVWDLAQFAQSLLRWGYEIYDSLPHGSLGQSPREAYELGLERTGLREHTLIPDDESFRMATLPSTLKGTAKVIPGRGVKIYGIFYWCESFRSGRVASTQVPVCYDPADISIAYAYVEGGWQNCRSEYRDALQGCTERERQVISEEIRQQNRQAGRQLEIRAKTLAEFRHSPKETEAVLLQRMRDDEGKLSSGLSPSQKAPAMKAMPEDAVNLGAAAGSRAGEWNGAWQDAEESSEEDEADSPTSESGLYGDF